MVALSERNQPVDAITLTYALRTGGVLNRSAGSATSRNWLPVCRPPPCRPLCADCARKGAAAEFASISTEIASGAYDAPPNVDEYLDESEHKIFEISERRIRQSFHSMPELTRESIRLLERLYERKELVTGVPTGFLDLDRLTAGLAAGRLDCHRGTAEYGQNRARLEHSGACSHRM